jgi:hypothetical protein
MTSTERFGIRTCVSMPNQQHPSAPVAKSTAFLSARSDRLDGSPAHQTSAFTKSQGTKTLKLSVRSNQL